MGVLSWPPSEFWQACPRDVYAAISGWKEANGAGERANQAPSRAEVDEMIRADRRRQRGLD